MVPSSTDDGRIGVKLSVQQENTSSCKQLVRGNCIKHPQEQASHLANKETCVWSLVVREVHPKRTSARDVHTRIHAIQVQENSGGRIQLNS